MKEHRIKPEYYNQLLLSRLPDFLRVIVFSLVILIPFLYYFHPRGGPYANWADFFGSTEVIGTGTWYGIVAILTLAWGFYIGKKSLQTLVVYLYDDHVAWKVFRYPEKRIYYADLEMTRDRLGIKLTSKANRKLTLTVPRQIDDFTSFETYLAKVTQ